MSNAHSTINEAKFQSGARKYSRIVDEAKMGRLVHSQPTDAALIRLTTAAWKIIIADNHTGGKQMKRETVRSTRLPMHFFTLPFVDNKIIDRYDWFSSDIVPRHVCP